MWRRAAPSPPSSRRRRYLLRPSQFRPAADAISAAPPPRGPNSGTARRLRLFRRYFCLLHAGELNCVKVWLINAINPEANLLNIIRFWIFLHVT